MTYYTTQRQLSAGTSIHVWALNFSFNFGVTYANKFESHEVCDQKDYIERVEPNLWEFGGKASGKGRNDSILVWKKTAKLGLIEDLLPKCRCKKMMYCFVLLIFLYYIINIR